MGSWRYVVSLEQRVQVLEEPEEVWAIRELYVDDAGKVEGWSAEPVNPQSDSWTGVFDDLSRMTSAAARNEVLDLTLDPPAIRARRAKR